MPLEFLSFVDVTAEFAHSFANRGMVTAALWSDLDGDGRPDLLVAYDWGNVACTGTWPASASRT